MKLYILEMFHSRFTLIKIRQIDASPSCWEVSCSVKAPVLSQIPLAANHSSGLFHREREGQPIS